MDHPLPLGPSPGFPLWRCPEEVKYRARSGLHLAILSKTVVMNACIAP